jgi:hypothetical protein
MVGGSLTVNYNATGGEVCVCDLTRGVEGGSVDLYDLRTGTP